MNRKRIFTMTLCVVTGLLAASAQQVTTEVGETNDNNTPLHLMKPAYRLGYGIPTAEQVKQTMDRVLRYIDGETPAALASFS